MPSSPRLLLLLPAVSVALAACEQNAGEGCPGRTLVTLGLHGTLDAAATGCAVNPQDGWNVPATLPAGNPDGTFAAQLSWQESAQRLAYCTGGSHAVVLYGTRSGDHFHAQASTRGAVLGQCAATCTPLMTETFDGDLSSASSPATFTGSLTETFDDGTGDCGTCQLPCTSRYVLVGTEQ